MPSIGLHVTSIAMYKYYFLPTRNITTKATRTIHRGADEAIDINPKANRISIIPDKHPQPPWPLFIASEASLKRSPTTKIK